MMYADAEQSVQYLVSCTQILNNVFNNIVRQSEIGMSVVGWNVRLNFGSLENVFG